MATRARGAVRLIQECPRRTRLIGLGAVLMLLSCLGAGYALLGLLFFEPTGNPPFAEAELGVATTFSFADAHARRLGVCIQGSPGDRYAIELTDSLGHSSFETCTATADCGFKETCEVGVMVTGSRVVVRGKAPARVVLHEAQDSGVNRLFVGLLASAVLFLAALGSFVVASSRARLDPQL